MTQFAGPFSSGGGANFLDTEWQEFMSAIIPDGVVSGVPNEYSVTPGSGMQVVVGSGHAILHGTYLRNDASTNLSISAADPSNPRIDLVVARQDLAGLGTASGLFVKTGTPAGSPTVPSLTQTAGTTWEIPLAQVLVPAGASSITSGDITDRHVKFAPFPNLPNSYGLPQTAFGVTQWDATHGAVSILSTATVQALMRGTHKGSEQALLQTFPDLTGSTAALVIVGGNPGQGIQVRLGNMSVFSGSGNTIGAVHNLGQTPSLVLIAPHGTTAEPTAYNNPATNTVDIYCTGAWTAIAIAQS